MWTKTIIVLVSITMSVQDKLDQAGLLVLPESMPSQSSSFRLVEKSRDQVVRINDSVSLTCLTSEPWQICGWQHPGGDWCDWLNTTKYYLGCNTNPRISLQKPQWKQLGISSGRATSAKPLTDCSISIVEVTTEDIGRWKCHTKRDIRGAHFALEPIKLSVAVPYKVEISERSNYLLPFVNGSVEEEVVCQAKGSGDVVPVLHWIAQNKQVGQGMAQMSTWKENNVDGTMLVSTSLIVDRTFLENMVPINSTLPEHKQLDVKCVSTQFFPNGSVIYESSVMAQYQIMRADDDANYEEISNAVNIGGAVVASLLVALTAIALAVICWAQKSKKLCYANEPPKPVVVVRETPVVQVTPAGGEEPIENQDETGPFIVVPEPVATVQESESSDATQEWDRDTPPGQADQPEATPTEPHPPTPPTSPVYANFPPPVSMSDSAARLLELIASAPPNPPATPPDTPTIKMPQLGNSRPLSEALTAKAIKRNSNQYVKMKPQMSKEGQRVEGEDQQQEEDEEQQEVEQEEQSNQDGQENVVVSVHQEAATTQSPQETSL